jgi:hypothetical protein
MTLIVNSASLTVPDQADCVFNVNFADCGCQKTATQCVSDAATNYANGGIVVPSSGLAGSSGYGGDWSQGSNFTTMPSGNFNKGGGSNCYPEGNWTIALKFTDDGCGAPAVSVSVIGPGGVSLTFNFTGDDYIAQLGSKMQLYFDSLPGNSPVLMAGSSVYRQVNPDGSSITYDALTGG